MLSKLIHTLRRGRMPHSASPVIDEVLKQSLTYLDTEALNDLYSECIRIEQDVVEGSFIEAGCALGGSAIVIAAAKSATRPMAIYDVFDTIPPPSDLDGDDVHDRYQTIIRGDAKGLGGNRYYGYEDDLVGKVINNFVSCGIDPDFARVSFVRGLFENTLNITDPVAMAHIDGDWYDSVRVCLERLVPHLQRGGTLIIDDYHHWSGCRQAVDDYFSTRRHDFRFVDRSRLHIQRI